MAVAWLFQHDRSLKLPYQPNLNAFIHEPTFRTVVGDTIFTKANVIRSLGNKAVHENQRMVPADGQAAPVSYSTLATGWHAPTGAGRGQTRA
jgi:type I restriction enzyme R subunit